MSLDRPMQHFAVFKERYQSYLLKEIALVSGTVIQKDIIV